MSTQAPPEAIQLAPYDSTQDPRWARLAHRLTGVLLLLALFAGVVMISLLRISPNAFNVAIAPLSGLIGVGVLVVVTSAGIFHALNTLRIAIADLTIWGAEAGAARAAAFLPIVVALWLALTAAAAYALGGHTVAEIWGTR